MSENAKPRSRTSTLTFFPRPEAHSMNWQDLLPPVQRAVRSLLIRLDGSIYQKDEAVEVAASCFLVHGDRGTGKTTVLLSAKDACDPKKREDFFVNKKENESERNLSIEANASAEKLKNVVWLDLLDLEPLPRDANLLTTVLTRVRNALDQSRSENDQSGSEQHSRDNPSILEEASDSARHQLNRLINDATLMWENIHEQNTRERANREVAAADIYAQFREGFRKAMKRLSRELAILRGIRDADLQIILPIDNIDRSTEHLYSIVKLAQMVSCPHLWLVMAGDRQDVDTFLERAYWKELIRIGEGAGAIGKEGLADEDEALVMARRQAAAASHKLLPPAHRIEVELVKPKDALLFSPEREAGHSSGNKTINLKQLLQEIPIEREGADQAEIKFIDLFYAKNRVDRAVKNTGTRIENIEEKEEIEEYYLTEAAQLGLRLSARGVLDLWQLAYWITNDIRSDEEIDSAPEAVHKDHRASTIARTMLRNVISESNMPSAMSRCLQERIIRRNATGGTILDFLSTRPEDSTGSDPSYPMLKVVRLGSLDVEFQPPLKEKETALPRPKDKKPTLYEVRSRLRVIKVQAISLMLRYSPKQGMTQEDMIPDLVAGWLIVLYDVLGCEKDSTVIAPDRISPSTIVECWHDGILIGERHHTKQLWPWPIWPMPDWMTFFEHDLCGKLWQRFVKGLKSRDQAGRKTKTSLLDLAGQEGSLPRLLATGWVACALETFSAFAPRSWKLDGDILSFINEKLASKEPGAMAEAINRAEEYVMKTAAKFYVKILSAGSEIDEIQGTVHLAEEGTLPMRYWLEWRLPLLLNPLFVPFTDIDAEKHAKEIIDETLKDSALAMQWKRSSSDILAEIEDDLGRLFPAAKPSPADDLESLENDWKSRKDLESLRPFLNLHRRWGDPLSADS
jgi:hypothetical protein